MTEWINPSENISWDDSRSLSSRWEFVKWVRREGRRGCLIESVGLVVDESPKTLTIAMDCDPQTRKVNFSASIPKSAIRKLRSIGKI